MKHEDIQAIKKGLIQLMKIATTNAECAEEFDDHISAALMRKEADNLYKAAKALDILEKWKAI